MDSDRRDRSGLEIGDFKKKILTLVGRRKESEISKPTLLATASIVSYVISGKLESTDEDNSNSSK